VLEEENTEQKPGKYILGGLTHIDSLQKTLEELRKKNAESCAILGHQTYLKLKITEEYFVLLVVIYGGKSDNISANRVDLEVYDQTSEPKCRPGTIQGMVSDAFAAEGKSITTSIEIKGKKLIASHGGTSEQHVDYMLSMLNTPNKETNPPSLESYPSSGFNTYLLSLTPWSLPIFCHNYRCAIASATLLSAAVIAVVVMTSLSFGGPTALPALAAALKVSLVGATAIISLFSLCAGGLLTFTGISAVAATKKPAGAKFFSPCYVPASKTNSHKKTQNLINP